jgi:hypothetical protein
MDYKELAPHLDQLRADLRRELLRQEEVDARVAYLTKVIEGIEGLLGPEAPPGPELPGLTGEPTQKNGAPPTLVGTKAIRAIMKENPHPWRPKEIYKLLARRGWLSPNARDPRRGVEAALNRMWRSGEIERLGPGRYQYKLVETTGSEEP